jgi:hypothetical protein
MDLSPTNGSAPAGVERKPLPRRHTTGYGGYACVADPSIPVFQSYGGANTTFTSAPLGNNTTTEVRGGDE